MHPFPNPNVILSSNPNQSVLSLIQTEVLNLSFPFFIEDRGDGISFHGGNAYNLRGKVNKVTRESNIVEDSATLSTGADTMYDVREMTIKVEPLISKKSKCPSLGTQLLLSYYSCLSLLLESDIKIGFNLPIRVPIKEIYVRPSDNIIVNNNNLWVIPPFPSTKDRNFEGKSVCIPSQSVDIDIKMKNIPLNREAKPYKNHSYIWPGMLSVQGSILKLK